MKEQVKTPENYNIDCDICGAPAKGELVYDDGECFNGCADCILEIAADPKKSIFQINEWPEMEMP